MTTIVLADDHPVVRQGLRDLLEVEPDFRVVGETGDGLEAVRLAEGLRPHVLMLDLMMPGLNGLEVTRQVRGRCPQTQVLILSVHDSEAYVLEALKNGASGYVLKRADAEDLVRAVREVAAGRRYLSPPLSGRVAEVCAQKAGGVAQDAYEMLSAREREVLHLAAEGRSNPEIAARLFISVRTVETYRAHLMQKLGLRTQTDLVRYALRRGILPME
ncbi:response regulator transcription factor [bacterium]|nr:response regulator transcription factor [bacterium]